MTLRAIPIAALLLAVAPLHAAAQSVSGVAIGPEGDPLARTTVVLHRVGGGGGAFITTDTTDADGRFRFALEPADSGVYFAALRYEDRLYIGPAIRGGGDPITGYAVRVEPGSEAGAVASALSGQAPAAAAQPGRARGAAATPASDTGAYLLVALLALGAAGAFYFAAPRYRRNRRRDALLELATVENALAAPESPEDRARLETTRDRLRKQLAPEA